MNSNQDKLSGEVRLPYFKQGDDLHMCMVMHPNSTKVDVKGTLKNHIELLQSSIDRLQAIHDLIPNNGVDMNITGDTHWISISGDKSVMEQLTEKELVVLDEYEDGEDDDDNDDSGPEDV